MQPEQSERFESREWAVSYFGSLRPAWLPVRLLGAVGTIKEAQKFPFHFFTVSKESHVAESMVYYSRIGYLIL